jgi:hypothetical protein
VIALSRKTIQGFLNCQNVRLKQFFISFSVVSKRWFCPKYKISYTLRVFDISTMNRLRTDSLKLIIDDVRWMSVRAGGKHPFGGLLSEHLQSDDFSGTPSMRVISCCNPNALQPCICTCKSLPDSSRQSSSSLSRYHQIRVVFIFWF